METAANSLVLGYVAAVVVMEMDDISQAKDSWSCLVFVALLALHEYGLDFVFLVQQRRVLELYSWMTDSADETWSKERDYVEIGLSSLQWRLQLVPLNLGLSLVNSYV